MVSVRPNNKNSSKVKSSVGSVSVAHSVVKGIVALVLAAAVVLIVVSVCNPQGREDYTLLLTDHTPNPLEFTPTQNSDDTPNTPSYLRRFTPKKARNKDGEFVITFVGDTMFQNTGYNWETVHFGNSWIPADGFRYIRPLLNRTDYLIMNLEGPITKLPITSKFQMAAMVATSP
jgi:hypothetical protein